MRASTGAIVSGLILVAAGSCASKKKTQLERVAKDWCLTIRASQVLPVYPLSEDVHRYYQSARLEAKDRIPLYRLAWDTALSAFAARQVQYETYFFGDPVRMAGAIFHSKDRSPYMERVREFLRSSSEDDG